MVSKENIRYYRKLNGMTQEALAEAADLSISYISQLETGRKDIGREGLEKIAKALEVSPSQLTKWQDCNSNENNTIIRELERCTAYEKSIIYEVILNLIQILRANRLE